MIGAIIGDMIGAPYEFDRGNKTKDFPLFSRGSEFTDDSVMTIAVAEALLDTIGKSDDEIRAALIVSMQKWGRRYPDAGYGGMFYQWLRKKAPQPYGSFGNGSAMRVSSAGWLFSTLEETRHMAKLTAEVTHNHPEGVKGAEAAASAIFMARTGSSKEEIAFVLLGIPVIAGIHSSKNRYSLICAIWSLLILTLRSSLFLISSISLSLLTTAFSSI